MGNYWRSGTGMASCLHKPTGMEKKTFFEIYAIEDLNGQQLPSRNDAFNIVWFTGGEGRFMMDVSSHCCETNTIFVLKPGQCCYLKHKRQLSGYFISFTLDFIHADGQYMNPCLTQGFFNVRSEGRSFKVDGSVELELLHLTQAMWKEFTNACRDDAVVLRCLLNLFIIYLTRLVDCNVLPANSSACIRVTRRFFQLIESNYRTRKMVVEYAQDLSLSPNYLNSIVKEASGLPASYHIQQRIILEAKRKAVYVNMSMKEVAHHLGFDDLSHFSRFFKKGAGLSFSDFKKKAVSNIDFKFQ